MNSFKAGMGSSLKSAHQRLFSEPQKALCSQLPWHCTLLVEVGTICLPKLNGSTGGIVGAHPRCISQGIKWWRLLNGDFSSVCASLSFQCLHSQEVMQHACGLHTQFCNLWTCPNDTAVHPPPSREDAKGALNYQPSPAETVIEHPLAGRDVQGMDARGLSLVGNPHPPQTQREAPAALLLW